MQYKFCTNFGYPFLGLKTSLDRGLSRDVMRLGNVTLVTHFSGFGNFRKRSAAH